MIKRGIANETDKSTSKLGHVSVTDIIAIS